MGWNKKYLTSPSELAALESWLEEQAQKPSSTLWAIDQGERVLVLGEDIETIR